MVDNNFNLNDIPTYSSITSKVYGQKKKINEVINQSIIVWKFEVRASVYRDEDAEPNKEYAKILFSYENRPDKKYVLGTSSYYIIDDLKVLCDKLPMRTIIIRKQLPRKNLYENSRFAYVFS